MQKKTESEDSVFLFWQVLRFVARKPKVFLKNVTDMTL